MHGQFKHITQECDFDLVLCIDQYQHKYFVCILNKNIMQCALYESVDKSTTCALIIS